MSGAHEGGAPRRVLLVATKPPWPPVDGGRVVLHHTLLGMAENGWQVTVVAPVPSASRAETADALAATCDPQLVPASPRGRLSSLLGGLLLRQPYTIRRHLLPAVERRVAQLVSGRRFDVVLCEQLQALGSAAPAAAARVPVVLRAHNVESRLWRFMAAASPMPASAAFALEGRRLASWERREIAGVRAVAAISRVDRDELSRMAGSGVAVEVVPAPFPSRLEPSPARLEGRPAVVVLASRWSPAEPALELLVREWWPRVIGRLPEARLHLFGAPEGVTAGDGVERHGHPEDSREAFPADAVAVIPPRHPTGVPIKGLEAWARGVPLVADPGAVEALDAEDGRQLLTAADGDALARALEMLRDEPGLRRRLVEEGRRRLEERHRPEDVSRRLLDLGRDVGRAPAR